LVKKLKKLGHDVYGLNSKNGDIRDTVCVNEAVEGKGVVFHLAGFTRFAEAERQPSKSQELNLDGTKNVVLACRLHGAKLVFTSTCMVYGNTAFYPTVETERLTPPGFYSIHKKLSEDLCDVHSDFIARLGAVYGPSERCHSVLTKFIKLIRKREKIPIFQDAHVTRDYVYVDDVVDALVLGIDNEGAYNVGTGVETSISTLSKCISKELGIPYDTVDMKYKVRGDVDKVLLDIMKIKSLGWRPKVDLKEGIKRCRDV